MILIFWSLSFLGSSIFFSYRRKIGCRFLPTLLSTWSLMIHLFPMTEIPSAEGVSGESDLGSLRSLFPCSCRHRPFFTPQPTSPREAAQRSGVRAGERVPVRMSEPATNPLCWLLPSCRSAGTAANLCSVWEPKQSSAGDTGKVTAQREDFSLKAAPLHSLPAVINILFPAGCEALTGFIFNST